MKTVQFHSGFVMFEEGLSLVKSAVGVVDMLVTMGQQ